VGNGRFIKYHPDLSLIAIMRYLGLLFFAVRCCLEFYIGILCFKNNKFKYAKFLGVITFIILFFKVITTIYTSAIHFLETGSAWACLSFLKNYSIGNVLGSLGIINGVFDFIQKIILIFFLYNLTKVSLLNFNQDLKQN